MTIVVRLKGASLGPRRLKDFSKSKEDDELFSAGTEYMVIALSAVDNLFISEKTGGVSFPSEYRLLRVAPFSRFHSS